MSLEDYFTWVYVESGNFWAHGNGKSRIDENGDHYVVSYRRVGPDGYYWDPFYKCPTLGAAKALAETAFMKEKKTA